MGRRSPDTATVPCTNCGANDAIQIELILPDSSEVTFNSCHRCEHRWWLSDTEVLDLNTVLEMARKH